MKAILLNVKSPQATDTSLSFDVAFINTSTNNVVETRSFDTTYADDISLYTLDQLRPLLKSMILGYASDASYGVTENDIFWLAPSLLTPTEVDNLKTSKISTYVSGVKKTNVTMCTTTATVSGGNAVFYTTDNGLSTGNSIYPTAVFSESIQFQASDAINAYQYGVPTISSDRKSVTVGVNKLGLSLGILTFVSAANGQAIKLTVLGN